MVLGFNHNVTYKGEVFHVQTEDSGVKTPHIITLLYRGGVILCSKKTSYADILMMDNLDSVLEELMKAQHKELMRRLKSGEFDERAFSIQAPLLENSRSLLPNRKHMQHPHPRLCRNPSGLTISFPLPPNPRPILPNQIFLFSLPCLPKRRQRLPLHKQLLKRPRKTL